MSSTSSFDAMAPLRLPPDLRLTPEQFELEFAGLQLQLAEIWAG
jgi:hypothetical protein